MVNDPWDLYQEAEKSNIDVEWFSLRTDQSMAIQMQDGSCAIALDPQKIDTAYKANTSLGHELGHCKTGSFYNPYAKLDIRERHEIRADKWAIHRLIPVYKLDLAVAEGYTTLWDLADYFGVTEDFMRKAVCWYTHGNLAADLYFQRIMQPTLHIFF